MIKIELSEKHAAEIWNYLDDQESPLAEIFIQALMQSCEENPRSPWCLENEVK